MLIPTGSNIFIYERNASIVISSPAFLYGLTNHTKVVEGDPNHSVLFSFSFPFLSFPFFFFFFFG